MEKYIEKHGVVPWNREVFLPANEHKAKMGSWTQEDLWGHTLGPLNVPIQSEAVCEVSKSKSDSGTSIMACDWIGTTKGLNVFSWVLRLHLVLVHQWENLRVPGYSVQDQSL